MMFSAFVPSPEAKMAIQLVREGIFDLLQFHKLPYDAVSEDLLELPHYFATSCLEEYDALVSKGELRVLFDSKEITKAEAPVDFKTTYEIKWVAGGITPENVTTVIKNYQPELIDVSGGIESSVGIKDEEKMKKLFTSLRGV